MARYFISVWKKNERMECGRTISELKLWKCFRKVGCTIELCIFPLIKLFNNV